MNRSVLIYNITMITIEQSSKSIISNFKRELKSEDFLLLTQENKQYRQLIKVMGDKQAILVNKISEMEKALLRLQNEKDQYKTICNQYILKIHNYDQIKNQLLQQYRVLKKEIENSFTQIATKDLELEQVRKANQKLTQRVVELEQNAKTQQLVIQQLREYISKLEKDNIDKKIKIFTSLVDGKAKERRNGRENQNKSNFPNNSQVNKASSLFVSSKNSNANSISFSFVSNQSIPHRKGSTKKHNTSIYI